MSQLRGHGLLQLQIPLVFFQELIQNMNGGAAGGPTEMPPLQELAILRARVIELDMRLAMARSDGEGKSGVGNVAAGQGKTD